MHKTLLISALFLFSINNHALAHSTEQEFVIYYNWKEGVAQNTQLSIPNKYFVLTEEVSPEVYRIGESLNLSLEPKGDYKIDNVTWKTGELGGDLTGEEISLPLEKAGSYPIEIEVKSGDEVVNHSVLINISEKDGFNFPKIKILVNGINIAQTDNQIETDLSKEISFTAEAPEGMDFRYIWNFDNGEIREGKTISYRFQENPYLASPVLRVVDEEGIYQDFQVVLKNSSFGNEGDSENKNYTPILIGMIVFLAVLIFVLLKAKSFLNKRL